MTIPRGSSDPKASGELHMMPGFKKTFPTRVDMPAGGRESFDGLDSSVTWTIKGVVAIKGHSDVTSETIELQVIVLQSCQQLRGKKKY